MQQITRTEDNKHDLDPTGRSAIFRMQALGGAGKTFALATIVGNPSEAVKTAMINATANISRFDSRLDEMNIRLAGHLVSQAEHDAFKINERAARLTELKAAQEAVAASVAKTEVKRQQILTVPKLASSDIVTGLRDNELRMALRDMGTEQLKNFWAEVAAGKHGDALEAAARSPVPGEVLGETARSVYKAFQTKLKATELAALEQEDIGNSMAAANLTALAKLAAS